MALILHIETSGKACSVALASDASLLSCREFSGERFTHAERLPVFMEEVMEEAACPWAELEAVAVSTGPGSYTGLRIGAATAKGLGYALDIPLIGIPTLDILVARFLAENHIDPEVLLCPMIDARRMEVYAGIYTASGEQVRPVKAEVVDRQTYAEYIERAPVIFFGDGAEKCADLFSEYDHVQIRKGYDPMARYMIRETARCFREKQWLNLAYFAPEYVKTYTPGNPRKLI